MLIKFAVEEKPTLKYRLGVWNIVRRKGYPDAPELLVAQTPGHKDHVLFIGEGAPTYAQSDYVDTAYDVLRHVPYRSLHVLAEVMPNGATV